MSSATYKTGDKVLMWASKPDTQKNRFGVVPKPNLANRESVMAYSQQEREEKYELVEVTFLGYIFSDEVVVSPPAGYYAWEVDEGTIANLREHAGNAGHDLDKYLGDRGLYMFTGDVIGFSGSAVASVQRSGPDGEFCVQCREFAPMAAPNMPDGKFKCCQCREDRYRMSF